MKANQTTTIIPAVPGYRLVAVYYEEKVLEVSLPIVAWRVVSEDRGDWSATTGMFPLTVAGEAGKNEYVTMLPDGSILWEGGHYSDLEAAKREFFEPIEAKKTEPTGR